jgi:MerR family transcriptional regulator, thiopeptide resistance regulator
MYTVSGLARRCGLSRSTILYYESVGVLKASSRSAGNYRQYGERDLERLQQIRAYRNVGLSLADIRAVVGRPGNDAATALHRRLVQIDADIDRLRGHQRVILRLLGNATFRRAEMITKDKWIAIMEGAGLSHDQMDRWHMEFERSAPEDHQEFLEFLHIPADDIKRIREWSRKGKKGQ